MIGWIEAEVCPARRLARRSAERRRIEKAAPWYRRASLLGPQEALGHSLGRFSVVLGGSWAVLEASWALLRASWCLGGVLKVS